MTLSGQGTFHPTTPTNLSGWDRAGNFSFNGQPPPAMKPTVGGNFGVPLPDGRTMSGTYTATASKAAMTAGLGRLILRGAALGAGPLGTLLSFASMMEWMSSANVTRNPDANDLQKPFLRTVANYSWRGNHSLCQGFGDPVEAARCSIWRENNAQPSDFTSCEISGPMNGDFQPVACFYVPNQQNVSTTARRSFIGNEVRPATFDEVRPEFEGGVLPSKILQDMIDWDRANAHKNGIEPFRIDFDEPGKVTVPNPTMPPTTDRKTVTTYEPAPTPGNPSAQRRIDTTTTTTTEVGITPDGDTITVKPKTTTTVTKKVTEPDGSVTETQESSTDETKETPKPEDSDLCAKHPDILACSKPDLDTPEGEVPKTPKNVAYEEQSLFGGGTCPGDKTLMIHGAGVVTIVPWSRYCEVFGGPFKAVLLACAAFIALVIVIPGSNQS
jgi:hypothetical protein